MDLGILRLGDLRFFAYDEVIQEQDVPKHKTIINNNKFQHIRT